MAIYANCPIHGLFESRLFSAINSSNVSFSGNSESCPKCGRMSPVLDGTFNFDGTGIAEFLSGPEFTRQVYEQFESLVETAKSENLDQNEFIRRTEQISPQLANGVTSLIQRSGISHQDRTGYLAVILTFLGFLWGIVKDLKEDDKKPSVQITNNYYQVMPSGRKVPGFGPSDLKKVSPGASKPSLKEVIAPTGKKGLHKPKKKKKQPFMIEERIITKTDSTKQIITRILRK